MKNETTKFKDSNIFEGMISFRAIINGLEAGTTDRRIEKVLFDGSRKKKLAGHLSYVKAMSYKYGFEIDECDGEYIDSLALGTTHGGLLVLTGERTIPRLDDAQLEENGFYMLLDGVEDPYNFGYALRSIFASGADGVVLPERNWLGAAGVVCRASAGASEQMKLFVATGEECVEKFKSAGYKIVCAAEDGAQSLYDTTLKKPILLAVGGEKRGLSSIIAENADLNIRLEYGREFPQAMSTASASSVLAFEVLRANR